MADNNESTMKWKIDIGELKSAMQDAKRHIAQANAEFKTATAGMDKWNKSIDGVEAKLKQLNSTLPEQKKILENLEKQYEYTKNEMGENSTAAHDLKIKIEEQKATIVKTETSIKSYNDKLVEMKDKESEAETASGKLAKTISDQEAELTKLKKAYSNAVLQYGENSDEAKKLAGQIENLSGELKENKQKLNDADKAANDLDKSLEDAGKSAKDSADGGFTVLKGALANLVAQGINAAIDGLKNLASSAMDAWKEYDNGSDIIISKTGATGDAAKDFEQVYRNVSKQVVASYDEMGTAVGEVNTRFGVTGKDLEDLSVKFLKFAKLNGTDVNSSIDSVQAAMAAWGLTAEDAGDMLDVLNKAGQDTGVSVDALADSLKTNAPALQEMGFNASDAAMFLANLDKNGVDASSAMAGLKKALSNATKEGKPLDKALKDIEDSMKDAETETDAIAIAMELFGDKSGAAIAKAVRNGQLSFEELGTSMKDFEGNVNQTFENTLDAPDKFALAIQGMRTSLADIVGDLMEKYAPQIEQVIGFIQKIAEGFFNVVESAIDFFIENGDTIIAVITGIAAAVATYLAFTTAVKIFTEGWQSLAIVQKAVAAGQAILNAVMAANPIGLVVAAIAGLVAAFVVLWNKSEAFREFWINLWEIIKNAAIAAWEWIKEAASNVWEWIKGVWESASEFFSNLWTSISEGASAAWEWIKGIWGTVSTWFSETIIQPVGNFFSSMWDKLKSGAKDAWEGIKSVFKAIPDWFREKFSNAWQKVKDVFSTGGKIFDGIKEGIVSAFKTVVNAIIRGINKVVAVPFNAINGVLDTLRNIEILGLKPFGWIGSIGVPQIPELARGGVLRRGQMALLEGSGAEAVIPLEKNKQWIAAVAKDMVEALNMESLKNAVSGQVAGLVSGGSVQNMTQNINFNQTINSPKAVDRLTLYRETNDLLFSAKVRLANV